MSDESILARQLLNLAERYEAKAKQLRSAAAIVVEDLPLRRETQDAGVAVEQPALPEPTVPRLARERRPALPVEVYEDAIKSRPGFDWDPVSLSQALDISKESARTMLYRLERRGFVKKTGRGVWRLAQNASEDPGGSSEHVTPSPRKEVMSPDEDHDQAHHSAEAPVVVHSGGTPVSNGLPHV